MVTTKDSLRLKDTQREARKAEKDQITWECLHGPCRSGGGGAHGWPGPSRCSEVSEWINEELMTPTTFLLPIVHCSLESDAWCQGRSLPTGLVSETDREPNQTKGAMKLPGSSLSPAPHSTKGPKTTGPARQRRVSKHFNSCCSLIVTTFFIHIYIKKN